jgi:hypothetical protein
MQVGFEMGKEGKKSELKSGIQRKWVPGRGRRYTDTSGTSRVYNVENEGLSISQKSVSCTQGAYKVLKRLLTHAGA